MAAQEKQEESYKRAGKPFKVSGPVRRFKGVVAGSLSELKAKAVRSLELTESAGKLSVFLDEDGTEIDDEDYFQFLPEQSKLLLLPRSDASRRGRNSQFVSNTF